MQHPVTAVTSPSVLTPECEEMDNATPENLGRLKQLALESIAASSAALETLARQLDDR